MPHDPVTAHLAWLAQRGRAPSTIVARRRILGRLAAALPVPLLEASPGDVAAWRAGLHVSGNSVAVYGHHVAGFYSWAAAEGLIAASPMAGVPLPRFIHGLPRPIGEEVLMEAVATAPPRVRPWLVLAGWAGLRAKEIALLRRERVLDTASPPVLLVAADATKGHRERIVPMSGFVLAELRVAGLPWAGWVFPRRDGRAGPNAPHAISHLAARHLHGCGTTASLHSLRHRFATRAYMATRDLRAVQALLGHADPASTALYAAFDDASIVAAVEALPVPRRLSAVTEGLGLDEGSPAAGGDHEPLIFQHLHGVLHRRQGQA